SSRFCQQLFSRLPRGNSLTDILRMRGRSKSIIILGESASTQILADVLTKGADIFGILIALLRKDTTPRIVARPWGGTFGFKESFMRFSWTSIPCRRSQQIVS